MNLNMEAGGYLCPAQSNMDVKPSCGHGCYGHRTQPNMDVVILLAWMVWSSYEIEYGCYLFINYPAQSNMDVLWAWIRSSLYTAEHGLWSLYAVKHGCYLSCGHGCYGHGHRTQPNMDITLLRDRTWMLSCGHGCSVIVCTRTWTMVIVRSS